MAGERARGLPPTVEPDEAAIADFWAAHGDSAGGGGRPGHFWFGDTPDMADELADLVVTGPKRATAGLRRAYTSPEDVPSPGQAWIVLDGLGRPVALIRTTDVRVGPLSSVTEQFAWDEGEGDRTRDSWLDAHERFFRRQAAREGWEFHPDIETVFERFALEWPDRNGDPS